MAGDTAVGLQHGMAEETRKLTVQIVAAHVFHNNVAANNLPALIDHVCKLSMASENLSSR